MRVPRPYLRYICWGLALCVILFLFDVANLRLFGPVQHINAGEWGDQELLDGLLARESDELGRTYRWAQGRTRISLGRAGATSPLLIALRIGGTPPIAANPLPVQLSASGSSFFTLPVSTGPRRYRVLLPQHASGPIRQLELSNPMVKPLPDRRLLGFRLDGVSLSWRSDQWLGVNPLLIALQLTILAACATILRRVELAWRWTVPVCLALAAVLGLLTGRYMLVAWAWQVRLLALLAAILTLVLPLVSLLCRQFTPLKVQARIPRLQLLVVVSLLLPVIGVLFPPFGSHDQSIHTQRLIDVINGHMLLIDYPSEFQGRTAITPITYYLLALPWTLLSSNQALVMHAFYALVLGTSGLLAALLILSLGGRFHAAALGLLLMAGLPVQFTILWWGFGPQIIGQWLFMLLAVIAAQQRPLNRNVWLTALAVFTLAVMVHNGSTALGGAWLSIYVLLGLLRERASRRYWLTWLAIIGAGSAIAFISVYIDMALLQTQARQGLELPPLAPRLPQIVVGFKAALEPIGIPLALLSLGALVLYTRGRARYLIAGWLASAAVFLVVDLLTGLQVRYGYFLAPMAYIGLALMLDRVVERFAWSKPLAWAVVALVYYQGAALWLPAFISGVKPTVNGLTH